MLTLVKQLCALCAMSALMQMCVPVRRAKSGLRVICGMLMLKLTIVRLQEIGAQFAQQKDLVGLFECLMR